MTSVFLVKIVKRVLKGFLCEMAMKNSSRNSHRPKDHRLSTPIPSRIVLGDFSKLFLMVLADHQSLILVFKILGPLPSCCLNLNWVQFSWNMCPQWGMCQDQSSSLLKQIEHTSMINEAFQKYKIKFLNFLNFHSKKPRVKRKNVKAFTGLKQNAHQQPTWWRTQKCCGNL